ncbi:tRNA dihydrouridine synthase [Grosmannia clavigera kw1407]|uniref:tRNA dihydrouridine synthase n=1 Tax=Grosmannia clavigera (strain kw1407 / UAMH 11150) TaxID=655863 RepID=F0X9D4_GROCL|nr:tRNA dihydrouridine synthase [Grosmannia clavigera kw1407]EFX06041.1 tRNA dihydrouridine synthase [Grosmannia clavigera kw1407]
MLRRILRSMMTSEAVKKVPIPPRGVDYRGKIVLAPMVRSGELPSRLLALQYGADLVWGPETIDKSLIGTTRRFNERTQTIEWSRMPSSFSPHTTPKESVLYRIDPAHEGARLVFQMGTCNPDTAEAAARLVAADVAGIDINAGCPKPFSTDGGMGAALLKTPDLLCAILERLVATITPAFGIGISVKIRLLADAAETKTLVRRLVATGITGLTVHCRTRNMRPRERAIRDQLRMVADECRAAGVACLMNGDVTSRDQALSLMAEYGVDGAMIATAAERNPSCFRAEGDGGLAAWPEVVEHYVRHAIAVGNRFGNTKYLLVQMVPGRQSETMGLSRCHNYVDVCRSLDLPGLLAAAHDTDAALGIDPDSLLANKAAKEAEQSAKRKARAEAREMAEGAAAQRQHKRLKSSVEAVEGEVAKAAEAAVISVPPPSGPALAAASV